MKTEKLYESDGMLSSFGASVLSCEKRGDGYAVLLDRLGEALGDERARRFHVHFSRIEFSAGGEKRHWTFAQTQFGPEPQPLMELLAERRLAPVIICESAGTQAEDAQGMKRMYDEAAK